LDSILLAEPRGFCAGVDRAIEIVERALQKFGRPIYVRHEIVHNTYVVNDLKAKGAIFIEALRRRAARGDPGFFCPWREPRDPVGGAGPGLPDL
jgi:4-hydroxy-3-methylbut-2-enyl diphosphate reductase IspH